MSIYTLSPVTVPGGPLTRSVSAAMVIRYLEKKGWTSQPPHPSSPDFARYVSGDAVISFRDIAVWHTSVRLDEVKYIARHEGRTTAEVLLEIAGGTVMLEQARDALHAAMVATAPPRVQVAAWDPDLPLHQVAAQALDYAAVARECLDTSPVSEPWTRVIAAAEDVARLALEQLHHERLAAVSP